MFLTPEIVVKEKLAETPIMNQTTNHTWPAISGAEPWMGSNNPGPCMYKNFKKINIKPLYIN